MNYRYRLYYYNTDILSDVFKRSLYAYGAMKLNKKSINGEKWLYYKIMCALFVG